jgi:ATP-dependent DNA helicase RecG
MTVFGDLDTSTLSELPAGRGDVQTTVVPTAAQPSWLDRAWQRVREEVAGGRQAYVVASRIDPGDGDEERPLHAVEELAPELAEGALAGLRVEMLHGRMVPDAKDGVMRAFASGDVDVLVSTTVIEVGVDVPNATVMVILDADRFGVSQLHQLRGRIGRGAHASLCLLFGAKGSARLRALAEHSDGFRLAEIDLELRGEGELVGVRQSGLAQFRVAELPRDAELLERARARALAIEDEDPDLCAPEHALLGDALGSAYGAEADAPIRA